MHHYFADAITGIGAFFEQYRTLIVGLVAAVLTAWQVMVLMRHLDERKHDEIGRPALLAAGGFLIMLLAFGLGGPGIPTTIDSLPYKAALLTLAVPAVARVQRRLAAQMERELSERTDQAAVTKSAAATQPSEILLGASAILIAVLWMIELAVKRALGTGDVPHDTRTFFLTAAGSGVLAMAVLQGVRGLVPVRGAFHRALVERWVDQSMRETTGEAVRPQATSAATTTAAAVTAVTAVAEATTAEKPIGARAEAEPAKVKTERDIVDHAQVLSEIARLASAASGRERYAFFDLPIEQLCGQIAAGADRLLEAPLAFQPAASPPDAPERVATSAAGQSAPKTTTAPRTRREVTATDLLTCLSGGLQNVNTFLTLAPIVEFAAETVPRTGPEWDQQATKEARDKYDRERAIPEYMRLRGALTQAIQRNVDQLQIDTTFWWKRMLRGTAFFICAVVGRAVLRDAVAAALCGITGGFVATVSRDLVAILEKARR